MGQEVALSLIHDCIQFSIHSHEKVGNSLEYFNA